MINSVIVLIFLKFLKGFLEEARGFRFQVSEGFREEARGGLLERESSNRKLEEARGSQRKQEEARG